MSAFPLIHGLFRIRFRVGFAPGMVWTFRALQMLAQASPTGTGGRRR